MDIKFALLGFLAWRPFSGYDLKKAINGSQIFYWSGNNNQIYTALVQLHKDGWVNQEVQPQERYPSRKVYTITEKGLFELKQWLKSEPEPPQMRNTFLVQLAWSSCLEHEELMDLLDKYEYEVKMHLLMLEEVERRGKATNPGRSTAETYIWKMIAENYLAFYKLELEWVRRLRVNLPAVHDDQQ
jgi:PadR family transcriptional regulator, regulatory protein AphA